MSRFIVPFALALSLFSQVACSSDDTKGQTEGTTPSDSGSSHPPSGNPSNDAASNVPFDSSVPVVDTGAPPVDDAGSTPIADASAPSDAPVAAACTGANKICLNLSIPASVNANNVVKLYIGFSQTKGGIPEIGKGATLQPFAAVPGTTMPLTIDNKGLNGSYFVNVGLYMQGGGTAQPKSGVDYSASTSQALAITSAPTLIGETLVLALAP